jgi:methylglutaconyl-CoA hydratase
MAASDYPFGVMSHLVWYTVQKSLLRIELHDPDRRNALSFELLENLKQALSEAGEEDSASLAMLSAKGPAFSAGMNLKSMRLEDPAEAERFANLLGAVYKMLLEFRVPLVCAVDGPALGGAVGIVLACDSVWMGPMARIGFPETRIGLVPALVSVIARRRLSEGKLLSLVLSATPVDGQEAVRLGLADHQARADATAEAEAFCRKTIRENSAEAMRRTKRFLRSHSLTHFDEEIELAKSEFFAAVASESAKRGLASFREKKLVDWSEPQG